MKPHPRPLPRREGRGGGESGDGGGGREYLPNIVDAHLGDEAFVGDQAYYACCTDGDAIPDTWVKKEVVWSEHDGQYKWIEGVKQMPDDDDLNIDPSLEELL